MHLHKTEKLSSAFFESASSCKDNCCFDSDRMHLYCCRFSEIITLGELLIFDPFLDWSGKIATTNAHHNEALWSSHGRLDTGQLLLSLVIPIRLKYATGDIGMPSGFPSSLGPKRRRTARNR